MDAPSLDQDIRGEQTPWAAHESISYYRTHRQRPEELYDTERFFLPQLLPQIKSVLDVGCATGGFSAIMHSFNSGLRYVGADITPELIALAKKAHPQDEFCISDGVHYPFPPSSFDLVHSSGVLHLNSQYQSMVRAMWDQTRRYLLCDFRLTWGQGEVGKMNFHNQYLPYHVLNMDTHITFLQTLFPRPAAIRARGYRHLAAPTALLKTRDILMVFFLIEKGSSPALHIDLQFQVESQTREPKA